MLNILTNSKLLGFISVCAAFISKYLFADWSYTGFLLIVIFLDTVTGIWAAGKLGQIYSKSLRKQFCEKILQYGIALILVHGFSSHLVDGEPNPVLQMVVPYFKGFMYMLFYTAEAMSVDENLGKLGFKLFPKWIRKRMLNFNENGELPIKDFTKDDEQAA